MSGNRRACKRALGSTFFVVACASACPSMACRLVSICLKIGTEVLYMWLFIGVSLFECYVIIDNCKIEFATGVARVSGDISRARGTAQACLWTTFVAAGPCFLQRDELRCPQHIRVLYCFLCEC